MRTKLSSSGPLVKEAGVWEWTIIHCSGDHVIVCHLRALLSTFIVYRGKVLVSLRTYLQTEVQVQVAAWDAFNAMHVLITTSTST